MPALTCAYCGDPFETKRTNARFCSPKHRTAYAKNPDGFRGVPARPSGEIVSVQRGGGEPGEFPVIDLTVLEPPAARRTYECCKHCRHGVQHTVHLDPCRQC